MKQYNDSFPFGLNIKAEEVDHYQLLLMPKVRAKVQEQKEAER